MFVSFLGSYWPERTPWTTRESRKCCLSHYIVLFISLYFSFEGSLLIWIHSFFHSYTLMGFLRSENLLSHLRFLICIIFLSRNDASDTIFYFHCYIIRYQMNRISVTLLGIAWEKWRTRTSRTKGVQCKLLKVISDGFIGSLVSSRSSPPFFKQSFFQCNLLY